MKDAPDRLQRAMNHCLAQIGIEHAEHRTCAIDIEDLCGSTPITTRPTTCSTRSPLPQERS
jgi:3-methyladenine DNA glycosylase AlkD